MAQAKTQTNQVYVLVIERGYDQMIVNVTPHPITMWDRNRGTFSVPPCGTVLSARAVEHPVGRHPSGAQLVRTRFEPTGEAVTDLERLEEKHLGAIIVGSIIAAQAFPGRVFAMVPVPGFERVPPSEKRMQADKFATF